MPDLNDASSDKKENVWESDQPHRPVVKKHNNLLGRLNLNPRQFIDEQVSSIVKERYHQVIELLKAKLEVLKAVAEYLLKNETIDGKVFLQMAGIPAPAKPEEAQPE